MRYLVHHMLRESAFNGADREALVAGEERQTYAELADDVSRFAVGLKEQGVQRGDRVAVFLPPNRRLSQSIFSICQAGGVFVPIHHGLFPDQVAHILRDCGARGLISDLARLESLQHNGVLNSTELTFAVIDSQDAFESESSIPTVAFDSLCRGSNSETPDAGIGNDLAAILYTSGSTGHPKGVMLSHANILAGAEIVADYLSIEANDRILAALPFSFDAGLNQLTTAVLKGAATVMIQFRFGRDITQKLIDEQITGLAGVPSLWSLLVNPSSGMGKQPLPSLRYITNTGGAMPLKVLAQLKERLPTTQIFLMYGLTEAFRSTYLPPSEIESRPTSIGRAIPNTEIIVVDEHGNRCPPGVTGELVHRGPTVSLGYWGQPEMTHRVIRPDPFPPPGQPTPELVCYSGDMVKQDEDGYLYFVGRRDNQIKSSGFRISPTEVEATICRVTPVGQAAVVGIPDDVLGQQLVAFVIPEEPSEQPDIADLLTRCAAAMPRHMVPRRIEVVDQLPMTANGKVDYPSLRKRLEPSSPTHP